MWNGFICHFSWCHLEPFRFHPLVIEDRKQIGSKQTLSITQQPARFHNRTDSLLDPMSTSYGNKDDIRKNWISLFSRQKCFSKIIWSVNYCLAEKMIAAGSTFRIIPEFLSFHVLFSFCLCLKQLSLFEKMRIKFCCKFVVTVKLKILTRAQESVGWSFDSWGKKRNVLSWYFFFIMWDIFYKMTIMSICSTRQTMRK